MTQKRFITAWAKAVNRSMAALKRTASASIRRAMKQALAPSRPSRQTPPPAGDWLPGLVTGVGGAMRFHLYRPPRIKASERLPVVVMPHGCGQNAAEFAAVTRMGRLALKERFCVLCPEQYSDARGPDASRMVWAFAKRQFRPARATAKSDQTPFRVISIRHTS